MLSLALLGWGAAVSMAQVRLPLEGFVRPGRCTPVLVESNETELRVAADGAVPVQVDPGPARIVPLLILSDSPGPLKLFGREYPLRALSADDALIASSIPVSSSDFSMLVEAIFPTRQIVPVKLDLSRLLSGATIAWQSLDAVVLEQSPARKTVADLLAAGTVIAVRSADRPDFVFPWRRTGNFWVLRIQPRGIDNSIGGEVAYIPTQAWQPGQAAPVRRQILLTGVLISLLALATLLIRSRRRAIAALLGVCIIASAEIIIWQRSISPIHQAIGRIVVEGSEIDQRDTWHYYRASSPADLSVQMDDAGIPIVASSAHAAALDLRLRVRRDGTSEWKSRLPEHATLAFLSRQIAPAAPPIASTTPTRLSPMNELARLAYLRASMTIEGETPSTGDETSEIQHWPAVIVGEE